MLQGAVHIVYQAVVLYSLPARWGYCVYNAHASTWLGSEEGAAMQVLRDPVQIHTDPSTATLYRHLPLALLVQAVSGGSSRQL